MNCQFNTHQWSSQLTMKHHTLSSQTTARGCHGYAVRTIHVERLLHASLLLHVVAVHGRGNLDGRWRYEALLGWRRCRHGHHLTQAQNVMAVHINSHG